MLKSIGKKDRDILFQLNQNSRQPLSQLAKKLRLSKQSVIYRIKNLKEKQIISQFYTLINFTALGYKPYKIFLRLNNLNREEINKLLEEFKKTEYIVWTVHCSGSYDLILGMIAKNSEHFRALYLDLLEKHHSQILAADHSTIISAHQRKKEYLSSSREKPLLNNFYVDQPSLVIDPIDSKILSLLAPDSRLTMVEISRLVHLTPEAVRVRIKNLEKRNIIMGSSILLNFNKIGLLGYKVLLQLRNKSQPKIKELISFLLTYPKILEVINVLGNWDLEFDLEVESIDEFNQILTEIRIKFKDLILSYEPLIKFTEYSYNYYPIKV